MHSQPRGIGARPETLLFVRPRLKLKRRHITTSLALFASKRQKAAGGRYLAYYNAHIAESSAVHEVLDVLPGTTRAFHKLHHSVVFGITWTSQEKWAFFKSLSRRGKRNVELIAADVGSKSVLEVLGYLHALDSAYKDLRRQAATGDPETFGLLNYVHLPIAAEISETCISAELQKSESVAHYVDSRSYTIEAEKLGWSILDNTTASEIDHELAVMDEGASNLLNQTSPDLILLSATKMLRFSQTIHALLPESPTTLLLDSIYRTTMTDLHALVTTLTRQLLKTSITLHVSRVSAEQGAYFQDSVRFKGANQLSKADVHSACDLLGLKKCLGDWALRVGGIEAAGGEENGQVDADERRHDEIESSERLSIHEETGQEDATMDDIELEEELKLSALLDRYDACHSSDIENHYRHFLDLPPASTSDPPTMPLSTAEMRQLQRYGWTDEYEDFQL